MNKKVFQNNLQAMMLEATYHKKTCLGLAVVAALSGWVIASSLASISSGDTLAATQDSTFQVNVQESIAVAVTTPTAGASGDVNQFLRNTVDVVVNSNVSNGFTASMHSLDSTNLTHAMLGSSYYIPTMSNSSTRSAFPTNTWGYSLKSSSLDGKTYGETDAGNNNSTYYPLTDSTTAPIKIITADSGTKSGTQSIYFGAKANADKPAGTYNNTVVISVVTGTIDSGATPTNPITPTNPATPETDSNPNDNLPVYTGASSTVGTGISGSRGTTVYTTRSSSVAAGTTTTTTEISAGDNRSSYAPAQGVSVTTQSNIVEENSALPLGLAATAATAATAGIIFFIIAKRDDDDDEDEEEML